LFYHSQYFHVCSFSCFFPSFCPLLFLTCSSFLTLTSPSPSCPLSPSRFSSFHPFTLSPPHSNLMTGCTVREDIDCLAVKFAENEKKEATKKATLSMNLPTPLFLPHLLICLLCYTPVSLAFVYHLTSIRVYGSVL